MNEIARNFNGIRRAAGMPRTIADLLEQLGDIPAERVRLHPPPGTATLSDLEAVNEAKQGVCELVDGTRKRSEYFRAGVKQVWEIDPATRSALVYTTVDQSTSIPPNGTLDGADILPGFKLSLQYAFDRAERMGGGC